MFLWLWHVIDERHIIVAFPSVSNIWPSRRMVMPVPQRFEWFIDGFIVFIQCTVVNLCPSHIKHLRIKIVHDQQKMNTWSTCTFFVPAWAFCHLCFLVYSDNMNIDIFRDCFHSLIFQRISSHEMDFIYSPKCMARNAEPHDVFPDIRHSDRQTFCVFGQEMARGRLTPFQCTIHCDGVDSATDLAHKHT